MNLRIIEDKSPLARPPETPRTSLLLTFLAEADRHGATSGKDRGMGEDCGSA